MTSGQTILVTGAGGGIGSALSKALVVSAPSLLILLDHSEENIYRLQNDLVSIPDCANHICILGDVCDEELLAEVFGDYDPAVVYHLAAFKHLPLLETNPIDAVRNNTLGTMSLVRAALTNKVSTFLMASTDKAVNPKSVMGVSKRIAELVLVRWSNTRTRMSALRLVNVFGSPGSVVPLMREQISRGGPVTVTRPDATRYFITLTEAVEAILAGAALNESGILLLSDPGEPTRIQKIARDLIAGRDIPIALTGLRPGEKMNEELVSESEFLEPTSDSRLHRVVSVEPDHSRFDADLAALAQFVHDRDLLRMLETLSSIVPEYRPSETILGLVQRLPV